VAAALLGSDERLEYTVVGDTVNMAQRLQDLARPAGTTVLSELTEQAIEGWPLDPMPPCLVKGRSTPVVAYRLRDGAATVNYGGTDQAAVPAGAGFEGGTA
jgi:adenylate cyclase